MKNQKYRYSPGISHEITDSLHKIKSRYFVEEAIPCSKPKFINIHGCEIWMKIDGNATTDSAELSYVATDTNSPYTTTFEGKYAGKTVFYWLRWVNNRGEPGPWSSTISAIVAG